MSSIVKVNETLVSYATKDKLPDANGRLWCYHLNGDQKLKTIAFNGGLLYLGEDRIFPNASLLESDDLKFYEMLVYKAIVEIRKSVYKPVLYELTSALFNIKSTFIRVNFDGIDNDVFQVVQHGLWGIIEDMNSRFSERKIHLVCKGLIGDQRWDSYYLFLHTETFGMFNTLKDILLGMRECSTSKDVFVELRRMVHAIEGYYQKLYPEIKKEKYGKIYDWEDRMKSMMALVRQLDIVIESFISVSEDDDHTDSDSKPFRGGIAVCL